MNDRVRPGQMVVHRKADLPPMAWLARYEPSERHVALWCGEAVDVHDHGWFEGVWNGPFSDFAPRTAWRAGSGAVFEGDDLVVCPPSHTLEGLWFARLAGGDEGPAAPRNGAPTWWVANSLALLLSATGLTLDDAFPDYQRRCLDVIHGLRRSVISLPVIDSCRSSGTGGDGSGPDASARRRGRQRHGQVHLLTVRSLRMAPDGRWDLDPVFTPGAFSDYAEYVHALQTCMQAVADNGADLARRRPLTPLATVSSGYDSPACAVIAARIGARNAITVRQARDGDDHSTVDDSGRHVAAALGLQVVERDRDASLSENGRMVADEFWATAMSGEDVVMRVFEREVAGSVLITGFYGDTVWSPTMPVTDTLRREDVAGASMGEFRLRTGFAHVPLPFFGATEHASLSAISNADEMRPWRVASRYDRPIPRRLLEEAGVAGEGFGQVKKATTTIGNRRRFSDPVVVATLEQFAARRRHTLTTTWRHRLAEALFVAARPVMRVARPVARRFGRRIDVVRRQSLHGYWGSVALLWAVEQLKEGRYRAVRRVRCGQLTDASSAATSSRGT